MKPAIAATAMIAAMPVAAAAADRPAKAGNPAAKLSLSSGPASENGQGNGYGYGHDKGRGRGHDIGKGRGHDRDDDHPDSP